jgi:hypothetical protein
MTNEEFERLKHSIREKMSHSESNAEVVDLEKAATAATLLESAENSTAI